MPGRKNPMAGKGNFRHSNKIRTATKSATSRDVGDFDRQGYPGERDVDADPIKIIASYQRLGEAIKKSHSFNEVAEQIAQIAELAESTVTEEAGDWFDQHTIKRNMKELKSYAKDFAKISEDLDTLHQRATALYDDMGNVLARYFEVVEPEVEPGEKILTEPDDEPFGGKKAPPFTKNDPRAQKGREKWDKRNGHDDDEEHQTYEQAHAPYIRTHGYDPRGPGAKRKKSKKEAYGGDDPYEKLAARAAEIVRKKGKSSDEFMSWEDKIDRAIELDPQFARLVKKFSKTGKFESAVPQTAPFARKAIRTPAAFSRTHAGMTRNAAKAILKKEGVKSIEEAKRAITKEHLRRIVKEDDIGYMKDPKLSNLDDDRLRKQLQLARERLAKLNTHVNRAAVKAYERAAKLRGLKESRRPWLAEVGDPAKKEAQIRKIVQNKTAGTVEGQKLDLFTASIMVQILDNLNAKNRESYLNMPLSKMITIAFKLAR